MTEAKKRIAPQYTEQDKNAAWAFYIEVASRTLAPGEGVDENQIVESHAELFGAATSVFRQAGRESALTAKLVIGFLNAKVQPFVSRWSREAESGSFQLDHMAATKKAEFGEDLNELMAEMRKLTRKLAQIAKVDGVMK